MTKSRKIHRRGRKGKKGGYGAMKTETLRASSTRATPYVSKTMPSMQDRAFAEWQSECRAALGNPEMEEKLRVKGAQQVAAMLNNSPELMKMVQEGMAQSAGARAQVEEPVVDGCTNFQSFLGMIGAFATLGGAYYALNYFAPKDMEALSTSTKRNVEDLAAGFLSGLNAAIRLRDIKIWSAVWENMSSFLSYVGADTAATAAVNARQPKDGKIPSVSLQVAQGVASAWCRRFPTIEQFGTGMTWMAYPVTGPVMALWRTMQRRREAKLAAAETTAVEGARPLVSNVDHQGNPTDEGNLQTGGVKKAHKRGGKKHGGKTRKGGKKARGKKSRRHSRHRK